MGFLFIAGIAGIAGYLLLGVIASYPLLISDDEDDQKVGAFGVILWPSLLVISIFYWLFVWIPYRRWVRNRDKGM
jgi:hypothetical protein